MSADDPRIIDGLNDQLVEAWREERTPVLTLTTEGIRALARAQGADLRTWDEKYQEQVGDYPNIEDVLNEVSVEVGASHPDLLIHGWAEGALAKVRVLAKAYALLGEIWNSRRVLADTNPAVSEELRAQARTNAVEYRDLLSIVVPKAVKALENHLRDLDKLVDDQGRPKKHKVQEYDAAALTLSAIVLEAEDDLRV